MSDIAAHGALPDHPSASTVHQDLIAGCKLCRATQTTWVHREALQGCAADPFPTTANVAPPTICTTAPPRLSCSDCSKRKLCYHHCTMLPAWLGTQMRMPYGLPLCAADRGTDPHALPLEHAAPHATLSACHLGLQPTLCQPTSTMS
jgi:hypothetical protein